MAPSRDPLGWGHGSGSTSRQRFESGEYQQFRDLGVDRIFTDFRGRAFAALRR